MSAAPSLSLPGRPRVLIIDDEPGVVHYLRRVLERAGCDVFEALEDTAVQEGLQRSPDVVLLDLRLGESSTRAGSEWIGEIRRSSPDCEVMVMTGFASVDSAVECMRSGAFDYLEKPFREPGLVVERVRSALERRALRVRNRQLEGELDCRSALEAIVGPSPQMVRLLQRVRDLAPSQSNVLLQAESGTGKELIARAIHETGERRKGPFVPVDCGALPEGIAESELFGYERGAFTGADRASTGLFRGANGGTLFLDEVGELPLLLQSKLLRALQEREVRPLGASVPCPLDVRLIAATHRDLESDVDQGRFREDLFYRLKVVVLRIPALRERLEDVPALALHFLQRSACGDRIVGFEPEALEALIHQRWRGNVRELENCIEAAVALAKGPRLTVADLDLQESGRVRSGGPAAPGPEASLPLSLGAYERACLERALSQAGGDVSLAAQRLGIGRSTLYRKIREHGIR
ncbi:MAG: sigma-54-dependent transcriptional regulator [Myxococcota bacterium]